MVNKLINDPGTHIVPPGIILYGIITEYISFRMYLYQIFYDYQTQRNLLFSFWNEESIITSINSLAGLREKLYIQFFTRINPIRTKSLATCPYEVNSQ